jgi:hypothetical protein
LTDRWLLRFSELVRGHVGEFGEYIALSRDLEFSPGFITRHKSKLIFGSDCSCTDGHGAGHLAGQQSGGKPPGR